MQEVVNGIEEAEKDGIENGDSKEEIRESIVDSLKDSGDDAATRKRPD